MIAIEVDHVTRIYQKYSFQHRFKTFKSAIVKGNFLKSLRPDELVTALAGSQTTGLARVPASVVGSP